MLKAFLISFLFSVSAFAEARHGLVYKMGELGGTVRFKQETTITDSEKTQSWKSEARDEKGELVITETATMVDGHISTQTVEQFQTKRSFDLKIEDKKATFTSYEPKDGVRGEPVSVKTIDLDGELITGPASEAFFKRNWQALSEGKKIKADFAIFELSKAVGFEFKKVGSSSGVFEVEMKPSSFFISMLVSTIYLYLDEKEHRLVRYKGRTPFQEWNGKKWKPFDAEITYTASEK